MVNRRKIHNLVSLEDRQIVLNSEVVKQYPVVEQILTKYDKIYKSDFEDTEDFNKQTQTFFEYTFNELVKLASNEWYASNRMNEMPSSKDEWPTCSLCNTKNKLVYYIVNKNNKKELNVGSECIYKFPSLGFNHRQLSQIKNDRIKKFKRIERINKINSLFPGIENRLSQWKIDYEEIPLILPFDINEGLKLAIKEGFTLYDSYIEGKSKDSELEHLNNIIMKYDEYEQKSKLFVETHINSNFACDSKVRNWLIDNNKLRVLVAIMKNNGLINENTIKYIYEENFIKNRLVVLKEAVDKLQIKFIEFRDSNIFFSYKNQDDRIEYILRCDIKDFMLNFGEVFINSSYSIDFSILSKKLSIVFIDSNIKSLFNKVDFILRRSGYYIKHDYVNNSIEFNDKRKSMYSTGVLKIFCEGQTPLIFMNDKQAKQSLEEMLNKVSWKSKEEKSKYDIGNISRIPSLNRD
ncbi:hypothetical protein [Ruminiclostridium cellobioparum]|uniref:Uncharacterized protein n=1 Tax=Ruminiclostridium cellobioparum subsp. termitidis CT1112 TaxID=1195236 RepID=S0FY61_RUMCE|nr:hypothetical protein [Ruminiclostridium cellobioparum]EMS74059.1 hypothetical protein CTER_5133 [Ruminiclostridium cellobioparum subsp. termitidis CT1112]